MPKPFPALDGVASSHGSMHVWGNPIGNKPSNTFCLCFQNIGGLSQSIESEQTITLRSINQFINNYQADAYAFTKHNTCWDLFVGTEQTFTRINSRLVGECSLQCFT